MDDAGKSMGRLPWQADDVDGITYLDETVNPGEFADVAVEDVVDDYDFRATVIRRVDSISPKAVPGLSRALPMVTVGSYGR